MGRTTLAITFIIIGLMTSVAHATLSEQKIDEISQSIYRIYAINKNKQTVEALGSAVAITTHYLATNCHVAFSGNFLITNVNNKPYLARLCYFNEEDDLCIIDVAGVELTPVTVTSSRTSKIGDSVTVVGYPLGRKSLSQGTIKEFLNDGGKRLIVIDAKMTHGSSGGGLFDQEGKLIGITTGGIVGESGGYAIPAELIMDVIDPKNLPKCMIPRDPVCKTNP